MVVQNLNLLKYFTEPVHVDVEISKKRTQPIKKPRTCLHVIVKTGVPLSLGAEGSRAEAEPTLRETWSYKNDVNQ